MNGLFLVPDPLILKVLFKFITGLKPNDYKPNEILYFIRQSTGKTQKEFAQTINKSKDWEQSNELGRSNFLFKDLLELAKIHNIEIIIQEKKKN